MVRYRAFACSLESGAEVQTETRDPLGLRNDGVYGLVRDALVCCPQVPGLDAFEIALEPPGESKRPCAWLAHGPRGGA